MGNADRPDHGPDRGTVAVKDLGPSRVALSGAEVRRSDLAVRDHPLEVPRHQVSRGFIEESIVAGFPLRALTRGWSIDLDLDPVERRAWTSAVSGPDHEGIIAL